MQPCQTQQGIFRKPLNATGWKARATYSAGINASFRKTLQRVLFPPELLGASGCNPAIWEMQVDIN